MSKLIRAIASLKQVNPFLWYWACPIYGVLLVAFVLVLCFCK